VILLWGLAEDTPLRVVREALARRRAAVLFIDQRAAEFHIDADDCVEHGTFNVSGLSISLDAVDSAYIRPYFSRHAARRARDDDAVLLNWCDLTAALVVNPPSAMTPNHSKPYQASLIRSFGLDVPDTLITTDPTAALDFWEAHGEVVYKSISGIRSIVARLTPQHRTRLATIVNCPTQFQAYVAGTDFRVHVVGDECFACEIVSDTDDYRYAAQGSKIVEMHPRRLPDALLDRCRAVTAGTGLHVSGIDLRQTPDGKWSCFEVNPSPAFTYYEEATGQPIADAIARLLVRHGRELR
jgi:glutathione synthase/RimK-type ligase-like ATP-grasp enzyme